MQNVIKPGSIINVLWSLPFEIQMYIFLPLLFLGIRKRRGAARFLLGLWLIAVAAALMRDYIANGSHVGWLAWRLSLLHFVPNFLPGILAFTLPRRPVIRAFFWPVFIFLVIALFAVFPTTAMGWGLCLALGFAIPYFEEIKSGWLRVVSHRIAMYSYGIYLSHQFCIWLVADPLASSRLWFRIALLILTLCSVPVILYHLIEKPLIEVGGQIAKKGSTGLIQPKTKPAIVHTQSAI